MICISICTRERPKMLRRLLDSCTQITPDIRSGLQFIIIENGLIGEVSKIVSDFDSRLNIQYTHESALGIESTRNTGIEAFLKTGADWMATIDDDVTISDGWLIGMLDAVEKYPRCKVFSGPHHRITPEGANRWLEPKARPNPETGTQVWDASTANALFKRSVLAPDGLGLRFHPLFNLSGGGDTHLFFELKDLGEDVLWVREAECFEPTVIERTLLRARLKRRTQSAQSWGKSVILRTGKLRGGSVILKYALICSVNFVSFGVAGGVIRIFNANTGITILNKSLTFGCHAVGYFKALFWPLGEIYAKIDGE